MWVEKHNELIERELKLLPEGKQSYKNIFIAGFSQGGAGTLATLAKWNKTTPLGGVFGLSCWEPFPLNEFADNVAVQSQIPIIRYHGVLDAYVYPERAQKDFNDDMKDHTHVNNESHLKMVWEHAEGHEITTGGEDFMRSFFANPEFVTTIEPQVHYHSRTVSLHEWYENLVMWYRFHHYDPNSYREMMFRYLDSIFA